MTEEGRALVSVVIPVYGNEENLPVTWPAVRGVLARLPSDHDFELVFVDDGSPDASWERLMEVRASDPAHVRVVKLTRNFGQVAAVLAGLSVCRGDCCVVMSADLQDPPELILEFVTRWRRGEKKVVLGARANREDGLLARLASRVFYRLMRRLAVPNMPPGGFDFFLLDRRVIDIINHLEERNTFLQGQILWTGFKPELVPYTRRKRTIGRSRWTLRKKVKYFLDGLITYTVAPIRMISLLGLLISILSFVYAAVILVWWLVSGHPVKGWSPLMMAVLLIGGLQLVMLGVIGEYLWRNYHETRRMPNYVIEAEFPPEGAGRPGP